MAAGTTSDLVRALGELLPPVQQLELGRLQPPVQPLELGRLQQRLPDPKALVQRGWLTATKGSSCSRGRLPS